MSLTNGLENADKDRLVIDMIGSVNTPFDPTLHRGVRIRASDTENQTLDLHCVKMSDSGICARMKPKKPGRYRVTVDYIFDVPDTKDVETKFLILDGRFTGFPFMTREADGTWVSVGEAPGQRTEDRSPSTPGDDFLDKMRNRKADSTDDLLAGSGGDEEIKRTKKTSRSSLDKQLTQPKLLVDLVGAKNIDVAARKFRSLAEVTAIMKAAGLKNSNLIFGIDYTASNKTQGMKTFRGQSLHYIDHMKLNPYQHVISVLGRTLEPFANEEEIPAFGFGDVKTSDTSVFPIYSQNGQFCRSFSELLDAYNVLTPKTILSGPTNFAPIIKEAIRICQEKPSYYLLVIVADGQVNNEPATLNAIVNACNYPISILVVGVGDGPWNTMNDFDRKIPTRTWDNFDFVDFHAVTHGAKHPDASFAVHALAALPDQYAAMKKLGIHH